MDKQINETPKRKIGKDLDFGGIEAYNLLKTNLSFLLPKTNGRGKVVGITSSEPQEGKSFTSINLSYSLASDGYKVLLIDCDMRKPSIHRSLELQQAPGLSNLLVKDIEEPIQKGLHDNMSVLLSGDIPPNPSNLVRSSAMEKLLEKYSKEYDYVIVDLPPVNSVSDPIAISSYLDGMVLVIKHAYTRRKVLNEAIRQLKFAKANILGFVYNGWTSGSKYYFRKKNYYQYSSYYSSSYEKNNNSSENNQ